MTMIGASLLWVGWFAQRRFQPRSYGGAALAFINTILATAAAGLSWMFAEWMLRGKPSMLVSRPAWWRSGRDHPAAGLVGTMGGIVLGAVAAWSACGASPA